MPTEHNMHRARYVAGKIPRAFSHMIEDDQTRLLEAVAEELDRVEAVILGKAPCDELRDKYPVVLYFDTDEERADFETMMHEVKPSWETRKLPPAQ